MTAPVLHELYRQQLAQHPDAPLLWFEGRAITARAFHAQVLATTAWLQAQGVRPGDVVAVWLVNGPEWLALLFALARCGATLATVNTRYRSAEVAHILRKTGARLLIMQTRFRAIDFCAIAADIDPATIPALQTVALAGAADLSTAPIAGRGVIAFAPAPLTAGQQVPDHAAPDTPVILFTTSGTTKAAKLPAHTARTLHGHSLHVGPALGFDQPGATLLAALPLCGVFCLTGVLAAFATGAPVVVMDTFDAPAAAQLLARHRITHLFGSDEMFRQIADVTGPHDDLSHARYFGIAGFNPGLQALGAELIARGFPLYGVYGSSEVLAYCAAQRPGAELPLRLIGGGVPVAGSAFEMRVRDGDSGAPCPPGVAGALEIRAPSNFTGYFNDPEETRAAFTADGFFKTGDLAHLTDDGQLVYHTRIGDAIRLGGYLVNPGEIEDAIKALPDVADAQVVAVEADGHWRVVAFVIATPGAALAPEDITARLAHQIAPFKLPWRIWLADEFPRTHGTNGVKIRRAQLRDEALRRLAQD